MAFKTIIKRLEKYRQFSYMDYNNHTVTHFCVRVKWLKEVYLPTYKKNMTYKFFKKHVTNSDLPFLMLQADKCGEFHKMLG